MVECCCYVDCQEEITIPPRIYICERWKSTNQAAEPKLTQLGSGLHTRYWGCAEKTGEE